MSYGNISSDIFACGVILFSLVTCALPFQLAVKSNYFYKYIMDNQFDLFLQARKKSYKPLKNNFDCFEDKELMDLIKRMLTPNPYKRITLAQIREHPWFNGIVPT
jgi:serine/threonine protein kinase